MAHSITWNIRMNCWIAEWLGALAAEPEVGSSIPHCVSFTGLNSMIHRDPSRSAVLKLYLILGSTV